MKTAAHSYTSKHTMFHESDQCLYKSANKHMCFLSTHQWLVKKQCIRNMIAEMRAGGIQFTHVFNFQRNLKGSKMWRQQFCDLRYLFSACEMTLNFTNAYCSLYLLSTLQVKLTSNKFSILLLEIKAMYKSVENRHIFSMCVNMFQCHPISTRCFYFNLRNV